MGHIYLSHSHPIAIYACPIPSHPMGHFPWDSHRNDIPMNKPVEYGLYFACGLYAQHTQRDKVLT